MDSRTTPQEGATPGPGGPPVAPLPDACLPPPGVLAAMGFEALPWPAPNAPPPSLPLPLTVQLPPGLQFPLLVDAEGEAQAQVLAPSATPAARMALAHVLAAAPDLADACEAMVAFWQRGDRSVPEILARCTAALAKARGETGP